MFKFDVLEIWAFCNYLLIFFACQNQFCNYCINFVTIGYTYVGCISCNCRCWKKNVSNVASSSSFLASVPLCSGVRYRGVMERPFPIQR